METNTKSKYIWLVLLIGLLVVVLFFYGAGFINNITKEKPNKIITSDAYPSGTTINLYNNISPDFPKDVILENTAPQYSGTVDTPDGKKQITVVYSSTTPLLKLLSTYINSMQNKSWKIADTKVSGSNLGTILATKNGNQMIITFALSSATTTNTIITFQYQI